jgi:hypothetical protein
MINCSGGEKMDVPLKVNAATINQTIDRTNTLGLTPTGAALEVALSTLGNRTRSSIRRSSPATPRSNP